MLTLYRLTKRAHAADAWSGEGARLYGGRWNQRGTTVVYASGSLALAALELFVHLGGAQATITLVAFRVEVPDGIVVEELGHGDLPPGWREEPPPTTTKEVGTRWARGGTSAILRVPSVLVPVEHNYVLNPAHADFRQLRIGAPEPFGFDPRMWK